MIRRYERTFGKRIGKRKLNRLTCFDIQAAINGVINDGIGITTIKHALGSLRECFESAKNNGLIAINPCFEIILPEKSDSKQRRFLTADEQKKFLETAETQYGWYYPMLKIMLLTGMRIGLCWSDIDFENNVIHIRRALYSQYEYGNIVLMSMETYEHLINGSEMDNTIAEAEAEYAAGAELLDAREALASIRRKHFG